jgi:RNA polymerase sigma factor (sigma-70 family)
MQSGNTEFIEGRILNWGSWKQISLGDEEAYRQCYLFYYKRLFNYGRKFTPEVALLEDAIQESLVLLWTGREKLNTIANPHTYLFSTFRYILFRMIKKSETLRKFQPAGSAEPEFNAEYLFIDREEQLQLQKQLYQSIHRLTARQREAIFLRFFEGFSYKEVALILGISVKATYKIMARALLQLRVALSISKLGLLILLRNLSL